MVARYSQILPEKVSTLYIYIYDPGSAVPPPPPPPQWFLPTPPLWCGVVVGCFPPPPVVWCGVVVGCFPPPCGVVWFGCGLWWFPPFTPCGVVWVVVPPACLDLLGVFGKPMLLDRGGTIFVTVVALEQSE